MLYGDLSMDVMAALKERRAKAEAKLTRAVKALESAKKELADITAAERVMAVITGESADSRATGSSTSERDREIAKLLGTSVDEAVSPVELHPVYVNASGDNINLDAFRTALWRLQKKVIQGAEKSWNVRSENGRYWREPASSADTDEFAYLLGGDEEDDPETE